MLYSEGNRLTGFVYALLRYHHGAVPKACSWPVPWKRRLHSGRGLITHINQEDLCKPNPLLLPLNARGRTSRFDLRPKSLSSSDWIEWR